MTSWKPDSTETTRWGNFKQPNEIDYGPLLCPSVPGRLALITQRPKKILKPTNSPLFHMLPPDILAAIETWLAVLKYHYKLNHVLLRFKNMRNPVLHTIPTKYWTPCHIFYPFRMYNPTAYKWVNRHIESTQEGLCPYYECHMNKYEYITQLTPQVLLQYKLQVTLKLLR